MGLTHAKTRRWTVEEYRRLFENGVLPEDERVELIEGEIVQMAAMNPPHAGAIIRSTTLLVLAFHDTHHVSCQVPVEVSNWSEPQPDFAIIPIDKMEFGEPVKHADLLIEVSDSSLAYDRRAKGSVYAKWGLQEYWILDVRRRRLEVHRVPQADARGAYGYGWASIVVQDDRMSVTPLCRPDIELRVADLLIPKGGGKSSK